MQTTVKEGSQDPDTGKDSVRAVVQSANTVKQGSKDPDTGKDNVRAVVQSAKYSEGR